MPEYRKRKERYLSGPARDTHFKSMEDYRKFLAYLHIHNIPHHKANYVYINGKRRKVMCKRC